MTARRPADPAARLARALAANARESGLTPSIAVTAVRPWSSATFTGERVTLALNFLAGENPKDWLSTLAEADLPVRGQYVAALSVLSAPGDAAELEALLLADA